MATAQAEIESFNPRSPAQVKNMLAKFGIKLPDTSESTLEANVSKHPLIQKILDLRKLTKFNSTLTGYKKWIDPSNLIHTDIAVEGTETGRSSSRNPNLQNVDPKIRPIFVSRYPGGILLQADLSQLEYRLIAFATRDERLLNIFKNGKDIHKIAATFITGKPEDQITKEERKECKTINYASIYGVGKKRFYASIGREDQDLYYRAKNLYPGVNKFKQKLEAQLKHTGLITNVFGRSRQFFGDISYSDLLESFNGLFQSAGASILKLIIIDLMPKLYETPCLLVNECHDSLIIDSPKEYSDFVLSAIKNINVNNLIKDYFDLTVDIPMFLEIEASNEWK